MRTHNAFDPQRFLAAGADAERGYASFLRSQLKDDDAVVLVALVDAAVAWLRERGAPRVLLWTAERNERAQVLFQRLAFRRTMIEMTREL